MVNHKTKIKLIMPPRNFLNEAFGLISIPPLGMAHIASFLKQNGHDVELDDLDIKIIADKEAYDKLLNLQKRYNKKDLENYLFNDIESRYLDEITDLLLGKIKYKGYDFIGFSFIESSAIDLILLMSKKIKELTGSRIVIGGDCATSDVQEKYDFVDHVIAGSGETRFLEVINEFNGTPNEIKEKGIGLFPRTKPDFKGLPLDCYRNTAAENRFMNPGKILILPYLWSLGCPYTHFSLGLYSLPSKQVGCTKPNCWGLGEDWI